MSRCATLAVTRGCGGVKKFFRIDSRIITPAAKRRGRVQNGPSNLVPQASRSHLRLRRGGRSVAQRKAASIDAPLERASSVARLRFHPIAISRRMLAQRVLRWAPFEHTRHWGQTYCGASKK